jgi:hypothetical protein
MQRLGKPVSAAMDTQTTIEELLGTMISNRSVQSGYKEVVDWRSSELSFETLAWQ